MQIIEDIQEGNSPINTSKNLFFQQTEFYITVSKIADLPSDNLPEIAFVGRSNAGKSSAINILCHQQKLAFTSKKPGRTQNLNYFLLKYLDKKIAYLVDLPGYGFASVPIEIRKQWQILMNSYLKKRKNLKGIILLIDSRRPPSTLDENMINWFLPSEKPIHILLTKTDKLTFQEKSRTLLNTKKIIEKLKKNHEISVQLFSTTKRIGIEEAQKKIMNWVFYNS